MEDNLLTDDAILQQLGAQLKQLRLQKNITQTALAEESGVAKRTVERFEKGASVQLTSLVRIMRALGVLDRLTDLIPEQQASPMEQLLEEKKARKKVKQRASSPRKTVQETGHNDPPEESPPAPASELDEEDGSSNPWQWWT